MSSLCDINALRSSYPAQLTHEVSTNQVYLRVAPGNGRGPPDRCNRSDRKQQPSLPWRRERERRREKEKREKGLKSKEGRGREKVGGKGEGGEERMGEVRKKKGEGWRKGSK